MVRETLLILSLLFQRRERNYVFDAMSLISLLSLLGLGVQIDLWFIIVVTFVSILMISFGEVLRENVKRNPKLGHRYIRNYRKYLTAWKNTRKKGFQEFLKVMKTVPLPWRLMRIYIAIVAFYLFIYIHNVFYCYPRSTRNVDIVCTSIECFSVGIFFNVYACFRQDSAIILTQYFLLFSQ